MKFVLFCWFCLSVLHSATPKKLHSVQFLVVKGPDELSFQELYKSYQKSLLEKPKKEGDSVGDVFVFKHHKPSSSSSSSSLNEIKVNHKDLTQDSPKTIYFLKNHHLTITPDFKTFINLGFKIEDIIEITEAQFKSYQYTSNYLPVLHIAENGGPDEPIRVELFKSRYLQGISMTNLTYIGEYINPCVIPFRGRLFLATGLAWFPHDNHAANEHVEFRWFNDSLYPFSFSSIQRTSLADPFEPVEGIPDANPNDTYYEGISEQHVSGIFRNALIGQDPRMTVISDEEIVVVFTNRFNHPVIMGLALLQYNKKKKQIEQIRVKMSIHPSTDASSPNKNWSPFLLPSLDDKKSSIYSSSSPSSSSSSGHSHHHHPPSEHIHPTSRMLRRLSDSSTADSQKDLYMVQHINPLTIVKVKYSDIMNNLTAESNEINAELVSTAPSVSQFQWSHGHLRGGTNVIYLPKQKIFLSFFHSSTVLVNSFLTTYFFGAFIFTASPPFRLLGYTPYPIMNDELYNGPWNPLKNRKISYCIFPVSCFLHNNEISGEEEVILSFGHQDVRGFLGRINLNQLLQNIEPLEEQS
jgi:hypothetical protein